MNVLAVKKGLLRDLDGGPGGDAADGGRSRGLEANVHNLSDLLRSGARSNAVRLEEAAGGGGGRWMPLARSARAGLVRHFPPTLALHGLTHR